MSAVGLEDPFAGLPSRRYQVILVDPPWQFDTWSDKGRGRCPDRHYRVMATPAIIALLALARRLAARDAALLTWATWPMIQRGDAAQVQRALGFVPKSCALVWVKTTAEGGLARGTRLSTTAANTEPCLYASRGALRVAWRGEPQVVFAPAREHSRKPDEAYARIERIFGAVPRLELFARQRRPGWDAWGNEVDKFAEVA